MIDVKRFCEGVAGRAMTAVAERAGIDLKANNIRTTPDMTAFLVEKAK